MIKKNLELNLHGASTAPYYNNCQHPVMLDQTSINAYSSISETVSYSQTN